MKMGSTRGPLGRPLLRGGGEVRVDLGKYQAVCHRGQGSSPEDEASLMRPRTVPSGGEGLSASEGRACGGRLRPAGVMVVDGSAAGCPAGPLPRCPMTPAAVAGVHIAVRSRAIGVHKPRPLSAC